MRRGHRAAVDPPPNEPHDILCRDEFAALRLAGDAQ
jgi:hypothetical protein